MRKIPIPPANRISLWKDIALNLLKIDEGEGESFIFSQGSLQNLYMMPAQTISEIPTINKPLRQLNSTANGGISAPAKTPPILTPVCFRPMAVALPAGGNKPMIVLAAAGLMLPKANPKIRRIKIAPQK